MALAMSLEVVTIIKWTAATTEEVMIEVVVVVVVDMIEVTIEGVTIDLPMVAVVIEAMIGLHMAVTETGIVALLVTTIVVLLHDTRRTLPQLKNDFVHDNNSILDFQISIGRVCEAIHQLFLETEKNGFCCRRSAFHGDTETGHGD